MNLTVSDPQPRWIPELSVKGYVHWLRSKGVDPHEFAESYVRRTTLLGYPPDIAESAIQFVTEKRMAA